jgi:hypothetical protein
MNTLEKYYIYNLNKHNQYLNNNHAFTKNPPFFLAQYSQEAKNKTQT